MSNYTKIENKILERIITSDFTRGQLKILLLIERLSSGCQKPGAILRKGDLSLAGIEPDRRITELERLSLLNVVKFMRLIRGRKVIWINRNTDEWGINQVKSEKRLKKEFLKLVASNIPKLFLLKALWK
ncbi:MAG: replication protein, partial [Proteobacteria bacterium]|nr:replication protein [Pseudomonadota bacterium]